MPKGITWLALRGRTEWFASIFATVEQEEERPTEDFCSE